MVNFQIKQNETLDKMWHNWDLEAGYHSNIYDVEVQNEGASSHRKRRATVDSTNEDFSNEELPRRGIAPGKSMGLSVMLRVATVLAFSVFRSFRSFQRFVRVLVRAFGPKLLYRLPSLHLQW